MNVFLVVKLKIQIELELILLIVADERRNNGVKLTVPLKKTFSNRICFYDLILLIAFIQNKG